jgi:hypothetical protein
MFVISIFYEKCWIFMFWCFFDLKNVFSTVKILTFSRGANGSINKLKRSLRPWSIYTYFNSPRLKVKILTVEKTFFKSKKQQNITILQFFGRYAYHIYFRISARWKISLAPELVKFLIYIFTTIKKLAS